MHGNCEQGRARNASQIRQRWSRDQRQNRALGRSCLGWLWLSARRGSRRLSAMFVRCRIFSSEIDGLETGSGRLNISSVPLWVHVFKPGNPRAHRSSPAARTATRPSLDRRCAARRNLGRGLATGGAGRAARATFFGAHRGFARVACVLDRRRPNRGACRLRRSTRSTLRSRRWHRASAAALDSLGFCTGAQGDRLGGQRGWFRSGCARRRRRTPARAERGVDSP